MITYICQSGHDYTIEGFLDCLVPSDRARVNLVYYKDLYTIGRLPVSHLIFADLDRLKAKQLEFAAQVARRMLAADSAAKVLNHPAKFRQRFELLDTLWHEGLNPFRAYRLDQRLPDSIRFPVFLRTEDGAEGPASVLIPNRAKLEAIIARLPNLGKPLRGHLLVEYCDVRSADGLFRKFAAFKVGEQVMAFHIQRSDNWVVKRDSMTMTPSLMAEELNYVVDNPHENNLQRIFELARADFGRIDYGFSEGRLVTFEINSNPTFPTGKMRLGRHERKAIILPRLISAFMAIDRDPTSRGQIELPHFISRNPGG